MPPPKLLVETPADVSVDDSLDNVVAVPSPPLGTPLPEEPKPGSGIRTAVLLERFGALSDDEVVVRTRDAASLAAARGDELEVHIARAMSVDSGSLLNLTEIVGDTGVRQVRVRVKHRG